MASVAMQLDSALLAAVAGISFQLSPALQLLTSLKRAQTRGSAATPQAGQLRRTPGVALGTLRVSAGHFAVSYVLPVTVPQEIRQPGTEPMTQATISANIAEALAEVNATEGTADCSISGLLLTHGEDSPLGDSIAAKPAASTAAAQTGADYARQAWESRDLVQDEVSATLAEATEPSPAPRAHETSLLHMRYSTVLLRRTKRLVWAAGSAPAERLDGGQLAFDVCAVDPVLSFSTDAAFALVALAVEVTAAITLARLQPAQPVAVVAVVAAEQLPEEVEQAATAAVAKAGDAVKHAQRHGTLQGTVRVLGARVQLPLNDGYTFTAAVSKTLGGCCCTMLAKTPCLHRL